MGGMVVMLHSLLTLALHAVSGQLHALADLPQGKKTHSTHYIRG